MAREVKSGAVGSQFYILLEEGGEPEGGQPGFGRVVKGLDVVEVIAQERGASLPSLGGFNPRRRQMLEHCRVLESSPRDP
jgi:cyclophilin family peptidyl-prolyl cis-trans isomerase